MSAVTDSILDSTKASLGIYKDYKDFDDQIIMYINTAFSTLYQLGVGPSDGFAIDDSSTTWDEYLNENKLLNFVISYVHMNVRLMFDPPVNSFAVDALKKQIDELTWRINVAVDPGEIA